MIKINDIIKSNLGLKIKIPELIKTSKPGKEQPVLTLPFIKKPQEICVASILLQYMQRTKDLRTTTDHLFISTVKPYKAASAQTIGHWDKSLMAKAGVDVSIYCLQRKTCSGVQSFP